MFDLALIDATLQTAIVNARAMLEKRRVDYAGYPELGGIAEREEELADAERARAEFAKLRKAMEGAIERDVIEGSAGAHGFHVVHTPSQWAGHRVLLVKCDE